MKKVKIIIWDEITMTSKYAFEARMFRNIFNNSYRMFRDIFNISYRMFRDIFNNSYRMIRDIFNNNKIFGGKNVIVSDHFLQILLIIRHAEIEHMSLKIVSFSHFQTMSLKDNKHITKTD